MITKFEKFRLFENVNTVKHDLSHDFLDEDYISNYFDEHYLSNYDQSDIVDILTNNPNIISSVFDDDKYIKSIIRDDMNNQDIEFFDDDDYKNYIENHLTTEKESKIIDFYYVNNDDEDMAIKTEYDGIVSIVDVDGTKKIIITDGDSIEEYEIPDNFTIVVEDGDEISYDTIIAKK